VRYRLDPELVIRAGLTGKEREALELKLGSNYGTRVIADTLGISRTTVQDRLRSALNKLERATRLESV